MTDLIELVWKRLDERLARAETQREETAGESIAGEAFQFPISTLADAPLAADGLVTYACRFISDGRKIGEGAGVGTGVPCYYDPTTDTWYTFSSDVAVTT